jgi:hypothetical protein
LKLTQPFSSVLQYFNPLLCRCECSDRNAKIACYGQNRVVQSSGSGPVKIWNESTCQCRCTEAYRECSTGYLYDSINTCRYIEYSRLKLNTFDNFERPSKIDLSELFFGRLKGYVDFFCHFLLLGHVT